MHARTRTYLRVYTTQPWRVYAQWARVGGAQAAAATAAAAAADPVAAPGSLFSGPAGSRTVLQQSVFVLHFSPLVYHLSSSSTVYSFTYTLRLYIIYNIIIYVFPFLFIYSFFFSGHTCTAHTTAVILLRAAVLRTVLPKFATAESAHVSTLVFL